MVKTRTYSIVLTGGGTAGHVLPHFALVPQLRDKFSTINYIGSKDGIERNLVEGEQIQFHGVTCVKFRRGLSVRNIARNISIPMKLSKGIKESKCLLEKLRPDVVFSKGGFVAYPVVRAAARLGIPVVAHESDMTLGLANKMSVRYCQKVCTTFEKTVLKDSTKFIHTGAPIRAKIYKGNKDTVTKRHHLPQARNLLVMGGSLGAMRVNTAVRTALPLLLENYNVIHICGKGKAEQVASDKGKLTRESGQRTQYIQLEYADDIENYLAWADIVVSRAGSGALCELMALGKPTLFIPLSTGRGDQIDNADEALRFNAASVLHEAELTADKLVSYLDDVWVRKEDISQNTAKVVVDGTRAIVDVICDTITSGKSR